jgi:hypothetical protein
MQRADAETDNADPMITGPNEDTVDRKFVESRTDNVEPLAMAPKQETKPPIRQFPPTLIDEPRSTFWRIVTLDAWNEEPNIETPLLQTVSAVTVIDEPSSHDPWIETPPN